MNFTKIPCITELSLNRPEVKRWQKRMKLLEPYTNTVIALPCSMKKPYSQSKSHSLFRKYTKGLQEVIITSPFGICPREMEKTYPIQSYDASTIGDWSSEEIEMSGKSLKEYVGERKVIAHVSGGYKKVCEEYLDNVVYTCEDNNTRSKESLENLKNEVKKEKKVNKHKIHDLKSIARYQFNTKKADYLIPDNTITRGKFNTQILVNNTQIATLHFETGLYSLNLPAGEILKEQQFNRVFINFDLKTSTLFAPGIDDADVDIIPNDEVVIINSKTDEVVGVGKSMMNGKEMIESDKGIGVKIRHQYK